MERTKRETVLITGGLGFLGSRTANILKHYYDLIVIDNESTSVVTPDTLINESDNILYKKMDLSKLSKTDRNDLDKIISSCDYICHFAATVGVGRIDEAPEASIIDDFNISMNILPLVAKHSKRIIYASSSEVYGEGLDLNEQQHLSIGPPNILRWGYACGKLYNEFLIKSYGIKHTILRIFNVTGDGQSYKYGMVLPKMIHDAKTNNIINVYDQGDQIRSFCDVRDFCQMIKATIETNNFNNEVINIGNDDNTVTMAELAKLIQEKIKTEVKIKYIPFHEVYSNNSRDIKERSPNTEKLKQYYTPSFTLNDIIESML